jgi:hypothetical protein
MFPPVTDDVSLKVKQELAAKEKARRVAKSIFLGWYREAVRFSGERLEKHLVQ